MSLNKIRHTCQKNDSQIWNTEVDIGTKFRSQEDNSSKGRKGQGGRPIYSHASIEIKLGIVFPNIVGDGERKFDGKLIIVETISWKF